MLATATAVCTAVPASAATVVIDDFSTSGAVASNFGGNPATDSQSTAGADIIGGERDLWVSTDGGDSFGSQFEASASDGELNFTNGSGTTGQAIVIYDGNGAGATAQTFSFNSVPGPDAPDFPKAFSASVPVDTAGLGGLDFLQGNTITNRRFEFDVTSFDADGVLQFEAYVWDTTGDLARFSETLINPSSTDELDFSTTLKFDEFTGVIDWTDVGAVAFSVESETAEFDGSIGSISVVPLPASALLLLGGLGGFAAVGRRRRRKA
ncbi:VPLPA-CTERM sorting domain-containing protein [Roseovarius sp. A21]|uniref:VPLPA-CTERM sorting domain-containing protein n=2 Tax=Roseovarius bejariae TaxID=2576383 RepID=A0A844CLQ7_9RHOB|nr:VPLPA-CTERM sorting domain-containing protein [Roseovarius bejariae]